MNPQHDTLPSDLSQALLVGRVWRPAPVNGPSVVVVRQGEVWDITAAAPTVSDLLDRADRVAVARSADGESLGDVRALMAATLKGGEGPRLLAPCDLQPVKAAGVTFAI
ncbi:MAG: fumarylacetoacetate hydrolase, partial [Achromobacter sp.]